MNKLINTVSLKKKSQKKFCLGNYFLSKNSFYFTLDDPILFACIKLLINKAILRSHNFVLRGTEALGFSEEI